MAKDETPRYDPLALTVLFERLKRLPRKMSERQLDRMRRELERR